MKILLSIKPEYAEKIMSGEKRFEYRKSLHKNLDISCALVYATLPVGKLVGEFVINSVLKAPPEELWQKTKTWSGITKEFFDEYFADREYACALKIGEVIRYDEPQDPSDVFENFVAPQSFRYVGIDEKTATLEPLPLFPDLI
jgi:predicted transcriptional regulator